MLILTRKTGEIVKIGDDIEVMIVGAKNGTVRVGISAPADVPIVRPKQTKATTINWDGHYVREHE
mgnify:FL=1|tara:strand:+ start:2042 stop:2236 length:195 start_codon:yes stop_codon:yes gene_type:complete